MKKVLCSLAIVAAAAFAIVIQPFGAGSITTAQEKKPQESKERPSDKQRISEASPSRLLTVMTSKPLEPVEAVRVPWL